MLILLRSIWRIRSICSLACGNIDVHIPFVLHEYICSGQFIVFDGGRISGVLLRSRFPWWKMRASVRRVQIIDCCVSMKYTSCTVQDQYIQFFGKCWLFASMFPNVSIFVHASFLFYLLLSSIVCRLCSGCIFIIIQPILDLCWFSCRNGGTCIDGIDEYHCSCPKGYIGSFCECALSTNGSKDCNYNYTTMDVPLSTPTTIIYSSSPTITMPQQPSTSIEMTTMSIFTVGIGYEMTTVDTSQTPRPMDALPITTLEPATISTSQVMSNGITASTQTIKNEGATSTSAPPTLCVNCNTSDATTPDMLNVTAAGPRTTADPALPIATTMMMTEAYETTTTTTVTMPSAITLSVPIEASAETATTLSTSDDGFTYILGSTTAVTLDNVTVPGLDQSGAADATTDFDGACSTTTENGPAGRTGSNVIDIITEQSATTATSQPGTVSSYGPVTVTDSIPNVQTTIQPFFTTFPGETTHDGGTTHNAGPQGPEDGTLTTSGVSVDSSSVPPKTATTPSLPTQRTPWMEDPQKTSTTSTTSTMMTTMPATTTTTPTMNTQRTLTSTTTTTTMPPATTTNIPFFDNSTENIDCSKCTNGGTCVTTSDGDKVSSLFLAHCISWMNTEHFWCGSFQSSFFIHNGYS